MMTGTQHFKFVLLGCSGSNLSEKAYPFVVVTANRSGDKLGIEAYILAGWQNIREFFPDVVREEVLFFLETLSGYRGLPPDSLLDYLHTLSVGAVRFITDGECTQEGLDNSISAALDSGTHPVWWPDSFRAL